MKGSPVTFHLAGYILCLLSSVHGLPQPKLQAIMKKQIPTSPSTMLMLACCLHFSSPCIWLGSNFPNSPLRLSMYLNIFYSSFLIL